MIDLLYGEQLMMDTHSPTPSERELQFLDLTGRKAFWSQGFRGKGEVVAVLDTGVSPHREFGNRLLQGRNFTRDYNGDVNRTEDTSGHGTHCAGSIAGELVGMAPEAEILPVKVLGGNWGSGDWQQIIDAIHWVRQWRHPRTRQKVTAMSMSLSGNESTISKQHIAAMEAAISQCVKEGIAVFCSAGNTAKEEIRYPASYQDVICVGAVDIDKKQARFTTQGNHVDICNIGVDVLSACYTGGYVKMSGTSMATPMSAGLAALVAQKYKAIYNRAAKEEVLYEIIKFNTKDLGIPGVDKIHGAGFFTLQPLEMEINIQVGSPVITINKENHTMEAPPQIVGGRFMIPVRFVTDPAGAYVTWSSDSRGRTTGARIVY